jgi:hypothetical protein
MEYWLSYLATSGVKNVIVLSHDRTEALETIVGSGERWGLNAKLIPETRELTPTQALARYARQSPAPFQNGVVILDHLPGLTAKPLFHTYATWFDALRAWIPYAITPDRVGMKSLRPGVWVGLGSRISERAELRAPCWLGQHVYVGPGVVVGPDAIIENGAVIESDTELSRCWVGADTLVGRHARLVDSLALGARLVHWPTGACPAQADVLLCALRTPRLGRATGWLARLTDLYSRNKDEVSLHWKNLLIHRGG